MLQLAYEYQHRLPYKIKRYRPAGNDLLVVDIGYKQFFYNPLNDHALRKNLALLGRAEDIDSIMLIYRNYQTESKLSCDVMMEVFEPLGNHNVYSRMEGGFSTMCGNGIIAVAEYLYREVGKKELRILTRSGIREIKRNSEGKYVVDMGVTTFSFDDLKRYVIGFPTNGGLFLNQPIPKCIQELIDPILPARSLKWSIGFTGDPLVKNTNGEPHIIIQIPSETIDNIYQLRYIAREIGSQLIYNDKHFPESINLNIITTKICRATAEVAIATYERNLGRDPKHCVTKACGTGACVAGSVVMELYPQVRKVKVKSLGGLRTIQHAQKAKKRVLMKGRA